MMYRIYFDIFNPLQS